VSGRSWLDELCSRIVARLKRVEGVEAIALGGSRARGTARADSDVDIGLYYDPEAPFSIEELDSAASDLDDRHLPKLVTRFGDWGAGVNGGGWLIIGDRHVDLLYRDLNHVREVIEQCSEGKPDAVYQLGHPMGFQSQIYLGETYYCRPLYDPNGVLALLKKLVAQYPPKLRRALVEKHLFDARFELEFAAKSVERGDVLYFTGCLFRVAGFMTLVLYALNRHYFLNEKGAFAESQAFAIVPAGFHRILAAIFNEKGNTTADMEQKVARMRSTLDALERLCEAKLSPVAD
jgi:predicted nucleotidyltransferase